MTLANGNQKAAGSGGGGIYVQGGSLSMDQVVITNCVSAVSGGAIFSQFGSSVYIRHSTL